MKPTYVKKLESGYWYVCFGPNRFVQWPIGTDPQPEHVFGEPWEDLLRAAEKAVS